jgi:hypothetical protein
MPRPRRPGRRANPRTDPIGAAVSAARIERIRFKSPNEAHKAARYLLSLYPTDPDGVRIESWMVGEQTYRTVRRCWAVSRGTIQYTYREDAPTPCDTES